MKDKILNAPFMQDFLNITHEMWLKGWHERNAGNATYRLTNEEINENFASSVNDRVHPLLNKIPELAGEYFLVTGTGSYFKNIRQDPEDNIGIIRISEVGDSYTICWGLSCDGLPASELPAHLLSHASRLEVTRGVSHVVLHSHATNLIALNNVLELDTKTFTRSLWEMHSECIIVFPDGIGVLPWMIPGSQEIGKATAELMKVHSMVLWPHHGVFSTGETLDEAFGLIDTAEKAAEILVKAISMGGVKYKISNDQLLELAESFGVKPLDGIL